MSLEAQNEALIRRCPCTVLSSIFIPPFIISFLNTVLYLSLCLASSTPPMSFSHSLCPCRTIALVVGGASWNLPPPQLGLCTKTSFLSSNTKLFTDSLPSAEHLGATCYKKKRPNEPVAHFSFFSWENVEASHGTRWCVNPLWLATDIKWNAGEGGAGGFNRFLCFDMPPAQSTERSTCHSLSF